MYRYTRRTSKNCGIEPSSENLYNFSQSFISRLQSFALEIIGQARQDIFCFTDCNITQCADPKFAELVLLLITDTIRDQKPHKALLIS